MLTLTKEISLHYSQLGPGFWGLGFLSEVMVGGIIELTIVVLLVEVSLDCFGSSEEVLEVDRVSYVSVKVVLEVLEHIHVLVDEVVSSNSWESKSSVNKFP